MRLRLWRDVNHPYGLLTLSIPCVENVRDKGFHNHSVLVVA